jgi:hypothetical protein
MVQGLGQMKTLLGLACHEGLASHFYLEFGLNRGGFIFGIQ